MNELNQIFRLLKPLLKGVPFILLIIMVSLFLGSRYLQYATPMYESTTMVKLAVSNETPSIVSTTALDVFSNNSKIEEEVQVIKSSMLIEKALDSVPLNISYFRVGKIRTSELYNETPFLVTYQAKNNSVFNKPIFISIQNNVIKITDPLTERRMTSSFDQVIHLNGLDLWIKINESFMKIRPDIRVNDDYSFTIYTRQQQIDQVKENLDVTPIDKDVAVLRVTYKSPVARKAADLANAIVAVYLKDYVDYKVKSADLTVRFINKQLTNVSDKLTNSENAIEGYSDKKGIVDFQLQTETDLRKISDLKLQLAAIQMNLAGIDSLRQYIEKDKEHFLDKTANFESSGGLFSSEIIRQVKQLEADRKDLLTKYTDKSTIVKVLDEKIDDLTSYLDESIRNTQTNLNVQAKDITQTIRDAENGFIGLPGKKKEMTILDRSFELNEKIYNYLNEKLTEAEIAKAANISFHRIIQEGTVPQIPVSPNKLFILILSGFIGLLLSISGIYILDILKSRVKYADQIEKRSTIPVWSLPALSFNLRKNNPLTAKRIATELELRSLYSGGNVICFVNDKSINESSTLLNDIINQPFSSPCRLRLIELVKTSPDNNQLENKIDHWLSASRGFALKITNEEIHGVVAMLPELKINGDLIFISIPSPIHQFQSIKLMRASTLSLIMLYAEVSSLSVINSYEEYKEQYHITDIAFVLMTKKFQLIPWHWWWDSFKNLGSIFRKGAAPAKTAPGI